MEDNESIAVVAQTESSSQIERCDDTINTNDAAKQEAQLTQTNDDPYAYLERGNFTSEKFKIEIRGLPKFYGMREMRKLLNVRLQLNSSKIKAMRAGNPWAYVCFRNEQDRDKAIETLNGFKWKGCILEAQTAKPMPDPLVKKRKEASGEAVDGKRAKVEALPLDVQLKNGVTPYWDIPYEQQLEKKSEAMQRVLVDLGKKLSNENPSLRQWLSSQREKNSELPCELWPIRRADSIDGYRNKCEFSVGLNPETNEQTVGFRIGSYVNGFTGVAPVSHLVHIPGKMKLVVEVFEKFIRSSDLKAFCPEFHTGHLKQLMVRLSHSTDELMLVVGIVKKNFEADMLLSFKTDLVKLFSEGEGATAGVTSLYYHDLSRREPGKEANRPEHLWGEKQIHESLLGKTFSISAEAFFQVNTRAAEVMYKAAIELAEPKSTSAVVDICCGTGTIGICFSDKCAEVIGLELQERAIEDAKRNAQTNNANNCQFYAGPAEDLLSRVMHQASQDDIIAIVDPPRTGLHFKAIKHLRRASKLDRLVYVSCDPNNALKNFVDLGRPESKTLSGEPFVPVRAVPVDMFPYTPHCELLICFERLRSNGLPPQESVSSS